MSCAIKTVCVRVQQYCDLSCLHCWAESSPKAARALNPELVLSFVASMKSSGLSHVSISGGEPLLYPKLGDLLLGLTDMDMLVTITTNGFNEKVVSRTLDLIRRRDFSNIRIRVSVDGCAKRHEYLRGAGTYAPTMRSLNAIRKQLNWVGVNTVVSRETLQGIEELCVDLKEANADHWAIMTEAPRGNLAGKAISPEHILASMDEVETIARKRGFVGQIEKWNYLTAPHSYLLVEPDGRIVIPGTTEAEDIYIGEIAAPDLGLLKGTVLHLSACKSPTFFSWEHRPYFS